MYDDYAQFRASCDALAAKLRKQIKDRTQARVAAAALTAIVGEILEQTCKHSPASAQELAETVATAVIEPFGWRITK